MKKKLQYNRGEMSFGMEILLFLLVLFVIWVLTGGQKHEDVKKPFVDPLVDSPTPGRAYGPNEKY